MLDTSEFFGSWHFVSSFEVCSDTSELLEPNCVHSPVLFGGELASILGEFVWQFKLEESSIVFDG